MTKLKFIWDKDEEDKLKTQFGIDVEKGFAEKPEPEVPSYWGISDLTKPKGEPTTLFKDPKMIELQKINFASWKLWFKELKETKDKWAFLKGEGQSPELNELRRKYNELAPHMYAKGEKWMTATTLAAYSVGLASELIPLIAKTAPDAIKSILYKVGIKDVSKKDLHTALYNVTKGTDTPAQRRIFDAFIKAKEAGVPFAERLKGVKIPTVTPRFAFGTKLYTGLPADEIVKSLVEVGKVTSEMVKGLDPVKVSQVTQKLLAVNPVLANEFLKAVEKPEVEPIPKAIPKELEPLAEAEKTFQEEVGYNIKSYSSKQDYKSGAILKDNKIAEIGDDDHSILSSLPERLTYRFTSGNELYFRIPQNYTENQIDTAIKISPKEFNYVAIDILDNQQEVINSFKKDFVEGNKGQLKRLFNQATAKPPKEIPKTKEEIAAAKKYDIPLEKVTITKVPKVEEPETAEALRVLQEAKIEPIPKVEVKPLTGKEKFIAKMEEIRKAKLTKKEVLEKVEEPPKVSPIPPKEVALEEEPKIDLATPVQIKKAHAIANSKALISEKGKMKPQYRKIAEIFTGKKSIKDMTPEEAEMFIDQLNKLPEPKLKQGKLVAPSIPRTMKLTTEGFFRKKYGEPTPVWLLEDQTYYATQLGIHPLVEPFEKGKIEFDLEFRQSSNLVDRMVNKLNQIAKTPAGEKLKSKIRNIPTKAESKMAELLNKHETTPPGLSEKEEDIFKYFRNLSKDIWRRENEVREKVDLPPIKYKTAYFRHTADAMAKEMLEGKYPFPQGIKYWGEKMVGKKIFNPMEFHRKLSDDLIDLWSKDIRAVTKAMLWSGLKEIYLAQPAKFLNEQLNAISKDLPEYRNLSPRDQAAYDQTRVMPASTRKWLVDYINQVMKGQETELDASLNRIVTKSGLKGIFDKVLSPFGRSVGRKPITNIFMLSGRAVISGVMGWVPRQIMRNSFQPVQNLALYGIWATIKAYLPASIDKNLKELLSESLFLKSYTGFEELPTNLMGKVEKVWLGPYGIVAVNNAKLGMKAAYWNIIELIRNPKFKKYGWADPQRTKDTPKGFLYPSEKEKLLREMEFGASATQYQYIPMGMPGVFRYKALVPLTRLQSWWMNYFTKFLREATYRAFKGRPSWSGEDGPTLPWSRRVNFLKYLIIGGAILTSLGYRRSFLLGVLPVYMSPAMQVALGAYNYATATEDWQKKRALKQIYYSWKAFIPGSLAWRDFLAVWKGEKNLEEILFYGKKEEKKIPPPLKIEIPKSGKLKFTKPEIEKSTKLKFTF